MTENMLLISRSNMDHIIEAMRKTHAYSAALEHFHKFHSRFIGRKRTQRSQGCAFSLCALRSFAATVLFILL